jgi:hypothetical protein
MNIIFGDSIRSIPDQYTVLELDTFCTANSDHTATAYCLVERPSLDEFATMEQYKKIHADLMHAYRNRHWNYCEQAIAGLMGRWGGELDTFYADLRDRVSQYKENGVAADWTAVRVKDH